jgi:hypothetical protein
VEKQAVVHIVWYTLRYKSTASQTIQLHENIYRIRLLKIPYSGSKEETCTKRRKLQTQRNQNFTNSWDVLLTNLYRQTNKLELCNPQTLKVASRPQLPTTYQTFSSHEQFEHNPHCSYTEPKSWVNSRNTEIKKTLVDIPIVRPWNAFLNDKTVSGGTPGALFTILESISSCVGGLPPRCRRYK